MHIAKALVVDDSKVAHFALRKLLTERNIEVDWVGSGEEALTYMGRQHPDIIFMDVMMPGIDGFETAAAIINNPVGSAPPIIMCSANATDEDRQSAKASGAFEFFSKPYTPDEMDKILKLVSELPDPVGAPAATIPVTVPVATLQQPETPDAANSGQSSAYERIAERTAWATADRVARDIATDIARAKGEQSARLVVEQLLHGRLEEAAQNAARQAVQAAQETARQAVKEIAAQTEVNQTTVSKVARAAAEQAVRELGEDLIKKQLARGLMVVREELTRQLEQQLAPAVQDTLAHTLSTPEFKQQLMQILKETTLPMAVSFARQAATEANQEIVTQVEETAKRIKPAVILAGVALLTALAAILVHFFY